MSAEPGGPGQIIDRDRGAAQDRLTASTDITRRPARRSTVRSQGSPGLWLNFVTHVADVAVRPHVKIVPT